MKLAGAMGATGLGIGKPGGIEQVAKRALGNGRPTVVDVVIYQDETPLSDARPYR